MNKKYFNITTFKHTHTTHIPTQQPISIHRITSVGGIVQYISGGVGVMRAALSWVHLQPSKAIRITGRGGIVPDAQVLSRAGCCKQQNNKIIEHVGLVGGCAAKKGRKKDRGEKGETRKFNFRDVAYVIEGRGENDVNKRCVFYLLFNGVVVSMHHTPPPINTHTTPTHANKRTHTNSRHNHTTQHVHHARHSPRTNTFTQTLTTITTTYKLTHNTQQAPQHLYFWVR
jgi:hypothetical protein